MRNFATNADLIFSGTDFNRDRMAVEQEKLQAHFPGFNLYRSAGRITSAQGRLSTNHGNSYDVRIGIPQKFPYELPEVRLPNTAIDASCPHRFQSGNICVMKVQQWSKTLSLAFLVAKTAIWLNKYDHWIATGKRRWPGREQQHSS